ncbi:hypothetical protein A3715_17380 [Oleiphilus sp. HI0009]|nr:hypothetical protein A3715_17380 [Oleiphilus sp. HI0009]
MDKLNRDFIKFYLSYVAIGCSLCFGIIVLQIDQISEGVARSWLLLVVALIMPISRNKEIGRLVKVGLSLIPMVGMWFFLYLGYRVYEYNPQGDTPFLMIMGVIILYVLGFPLLGEGINKIYKTEFKIFG